jgi:O-antigen/teichoic acid export membrane protein
MIRFYGAIGASIATVIAESVVTLVQIYLVRKDINIKEMISISKNYILVGIAMLIITILIGKLIKNNFISIIVQVIIGIGIYIGGLCIIKDEFLLQLLNQVKSKLRKTKNVTEN